MLAALSDDTISIYSGCKGTDTTQLRCRPRSVVRPQRILNRRSDLEEGTPEAQRSGQVVRPFLRWRGLV